MRISRSSIFTERVLGGIHIYTCNFPVLEEIQMQRWTDLTFLLYLYIMHFMYRMHKNSVITFVLSQSATAQNITGNPRKTSKHVSFGSLPTMRSSTPDAVESHKPR